MNLARNNPHDALFKALLSDPQRAGAFLRDHLPNEIAGRLSAALPALVDGSYVDEALRDTRSDLLFRVELTSGEAAFVFVLIEHKSAPDPAVALQLAGYMVQIWKRHAGDGGAGGLRSLPPIIPMVCYHGAAKWRAPGGIAELIAGNDPVLKVLPGETYILRDLTAMAREELSSDAALRAGFMAMRREAVAYLEEVIGDLSGHATLQKQVLEYILRVYSNFDLDDIKARLIGAQHKDLEDFVGNVAERLMAEGKQLGIAEGEARGLAEGEAQGKSQTLVRLLERRFVNLTSLQRGRIDAADVKQLDVWLDRIFDGDSVDAVLDGQH